MYLTEKEEKLLNYFWEIDRPISACELEEQLRDTEWNHAGVFRTIKSLEEKQLIKVSGFERKGKQYARLFTTMCSKDEYYTNYILEKKMDSKTIAKISAALLGRNIDSSRDIVDQLQTIINELKQE